MSNMDLWDKLGKTDPEHTKRFSRAGGFKGTAIKPIYTTKKMTEQFGPAGKGWGMGEPSFQTVAGSDGQVAVYCTVSLWWSDSDGTVHTVYGVGGDMVVVKQANGLRTDDEAFKKAFTDAVGNAMKHLGMSADVHMGLFDDSKYVASVARELEAEAEEPHNASAPLSKAKARPLDGEMRAEIDACQTVEELAVLWQSRQFQNALKSLPPDWQEMMREHKDQAKQALEDHPPQMPKGYVPPEFPDLPEETQRAAAIMRV